MEKYLLKDAWDFQLNDCPSWLGGVILGFNNPSDKISMKFSHVRYIS